jgi:hypothetical protein
MQYLLHQMIHLHLFSQCQYYDYQEPIIQKQTQNIIKIEDKKEDADANTATPNTQIPAQVNKEQKVLNNH